MSREFMKGLKEMLHELSLIEITVDELIDADEISIIALPR
jgi:hypothetical protein